MAPGRPARALAVAVVAIGATALACGLIALLWGIPVPCDGGGRPFCKDPEPLVDRARATLGWLLLVPAAVLALGVLLVRRTRPRPPVAPT